MKVIECARKEARGRNDIDIGPILVYYGNVIAENIAPAKTRLSELVNAALAGEEVVLCKNGTPVVSLIPIRPMNAGDPCRVIRDLVIASGQEAIKPLLPEEWGELSG